MYMIHYAVKMIFIVGVCAILESCTFPEYVQIFNNTEETVDITFILSDQEKLFTIASNQMLTYELRALLDDNVVKVGLNEKSLKYGLKKPHKEFWSYEGFGPFSKITFKFQLEEDGKLYILPRDSDYPLKNLLDQPSDYPLVPLSINR